MAESSDPDFPFQCPECNKRFKSSRGLNTHTRWKDRDLVPIHIHAADELLPEQEPAIEHPVLLLQLAEAAILDQELFPEQHPIEQPAILQPAEGVLDQEILAEDPVIQIAGPVLDRGPDVIDGGVGLMLLTHQGAEHTLHPVPLDQFAPVHHTSVLFEAIARRLDYYIRWERRAPRSIVPARVPRKSFPDYSRYFP